MHTQSINYLMGNQKILSLRSITGMPDNTIYAWLRSLLLLFTTTVIIIALTWLVFPN